MTHLGPRTENYTKITFIAIGLFFYNSSLPGIGEWNATETLGANSSINNKCRLRFLQTGISNINRFVV